MDESAPQQQPAYQRIADDLRARIAAGEFDDDPRLPSTAKLTEEYGVLRGVAQQAMYALRAAGLIELRQGAGAFVRRFPKIRRRSPERLARAQWGTGKAIQDHDTMPRPRTVDIKVGRMEPPPWVAEALGVEPGEQVAFRSRQFAVEKRRVMLSTSYIPLDLARDTPILETNSGPGGIYARLAEAGFAPEWFDEDISARAPFPGEVDELDVPKVRPLVFEITRYAWAVSKGRVVEVNHMVADAEVYDLSYGFPA